MIYIIYYYLENNKKEFQKRFNSEHDAQDFYNNLINKGARFKIFRKKI